MTEYVLVYVVTLQRKKKIRRIGFVTADKKGTTDEAYDKIGMTLVEEGVRKHPSLRDAILYFEPVLYVTAELAEFCSSQDLLHHVSLLKEKDRQPEL